jgi:hypothetical protein|tara:strand:- start:45 stop:221 length:177 start_codon:yes stop_codon:yes gene_type:complete
MAKKDKKEVSSEEVKEEAPVEEPQPKPKEEGRKIKKEIAGIGYTNIVYDNGETEKRYH